MTPQQTDRLIDALETIASRLEDISDHLHSIAYDTDAAKENSTAQQLLSTMTAAATEIRKAQGADFSFP